MSIIEISSNQVYHKVLGVGIGTTPSTSVFMTANTMKCDTMSILSSCSLSNTKIGIGTQSPLYDIHSTTSGLIHTTSTSYIYGTTPNPTANITTLTASNVDMSLRDSSYFNMYTLASNGVIPFGTTVNTDIVASFSTITLRGTAWLLTASFDAYRPTAGLSTYDVRFSYSSGVGPLYSLGMTYSFYFNQANIKNHITIRKVIYPSSLATPILLPYTVGYINVSCSTNTAFDVNSKLNATLIELLSN